MDHTGEGDKTCELVHFENKLDFLKKGVDISYIPCYIYQALGSAATETPEWRNW